VKGVPVEVLPGELRNHMGWQMLDMSEVLPESTTEPCGIADTGSVNRTKEPHWVAHAAKYARDRSASKWPLNSHTRGQRCLER
jgi:hypothetical protein